MELCGENSWLISSAHHGLVETPLFDFYPALNLDEALAFEAGSWKERDENHEQFASFVKGSDIYDVFSRAFDRGFPWLNKNKKISDSNVELYQSQNPFNGNLKSRLETVSTLHVEGLKSLLEAETYIWVSEGEYYRRKREQDENAQRLRHMGFLPTYLKDMKEEKIVQRYVLEVTRLLSDYPSKVIDVNFKPFIAPISAPQPALFDS